MKEGATLASQGIPVLLLTGPLGAGKTTLLNHILSAHPNPRTVALVINEVGAVAIDPTLLSRTYEQPNVERSQPGDSMTMSTLTSGCICCTIRNDFIDSMCELLRRLDRREENKIQYIVVETTGLADPNPIMNSITETELSESLYLDQVLSVIDYPSLLAINPNRKRDTAPLHPQKGKEITMMSIIKRQMTAADTVYITKLDLVSSPVDETRSSSVVHTNSEASASATPTETASTIVRTIRPSARIIPGISLVLSQSFPWHLILDIESRRRENPTRNESSSAHGPSGHLHRTDETCDSCYRADGAVPAPQFGINSISYTSSQPFSLRKFRQYLDTLSVDVLRAKGILQFAGYRERFVLQVSGGRFEVSQDDWPTGAEKGCRVVVIGFGLDEKQISEGLGRCVEPADVVADSDSSGGEWE